MFHRFHNCCQSFLFSHRHRLGLKRQMKKNAKMQDICNKETKTTVASLGLYHGDISPLQNCHYYENGGISSALRLLLYIFTYLDERIF